jgi:hypothetical protein
MGDFVAAGLAAGAAIVAVIGAGLLAARGALPWAVVAALAVLLIRTLLLVCFPRLNLRARTLGFIELALGIGFVATAALAWRFLANA